MMKDFAGNEIKIGDTVAIVYHPEAYRFSVEVAVIKEIKGKRNMVITQIQNSSETPGYMPDETGEIYRKLVKINPEFPLVEDGCAVDAVGHVIKVGDRIACRMPTEGGGNTVKGFEKGGEVTKLTSKFAFYKEEATDLIKRKAFNGVVVY